jgi:tetratricopeptide (TPR) repeat protein
MGHVDKSIECLLTAIELSKDPRLGSREELPITETLLNIANAYSYLGNHEKAVLYAKYALVSAAQKCHKIENEMLTAPPDT